jgi:putative transcriptional regulator
MRIDMQMHAKGRPMNPAVTTLRHWERDVRPPGGASLVLLNVIDRDPEAVLDALH